MSNIDDKIRAALSETDQALFDSLSEPSVFEMIADTFSSKLRWLSWLMGVFILVFTILAFYCAYQFFQSVDIKHLIAWATGFMFCTQAVWLMKQWTWAQMDRTALTREVKRLELQVAALVQSLAK